MTTALGILPGGCVVAGSVPTGAGGALPSGDPAACLLVLNSQGTTGTALPGETDQARYDLAPRISQRLIVFYYAVNFCHNGRARAVVGRETLADLMSRRRPPRADRPRRAELTRLYTTSLLS